MDKNLYVVVLAGGSGTRFWPLSRELYPKQFLRLLGSETMLQRTVRSALDLVGRGRNSGPKRVCLVTNEQQADTVRTQLSGSLSEIQLILEPYARNTALAIGLSANRIFHQDPEAVLVVMPADHIIKKRAAFLRAVKMALRAAAGGSLVLLGVKPTRPETGFGYIKSVARSRGKKQGACPVEAFVEKPDRATAQRYLREGRYFWNSGIFVFRAAAIRRAIERRLPAVSRGLQRIEKVTGTEKERGVTRRVYKGLPSVSIDHGVIEQTDKNELAVVPVEMGWSDLGSWSALDEVAPRNRSGNVVEGNIIEIDSRDSVLYAGRRPVAVIGLNGMVVVDTPDATLVCSKERAQEVRRVVDVLRERNAEEQKSPRTVERPWGSYTVLEEGPGYKIKRIVVKPSGRLSLQFHHRRSEHWVVVAGVARVTRNEEVFEVGRNESTYIPKGARHRLENPGEKPLEIIEVQNGDYLGEDDIVRIQDDYGRDLKSAHP